MILKKFSIIALLLVAINIHFFNVPVFSIPTASAADSCSISLSVDYPDPDHLRTKWRINDRTLTSGDKLQILMIFDDDPLKSPYSTQVTSPSPIKWPWKSLMPEGSTKITVGLILSDNSNNVLCKSNTVDTVPKDESSTGNRDNPGGDASCGAAPDLTIKSTKKDSDVTIELGWENKGTSTATTNRSNVYRDGVKLTEVEIRTDKYFYYKETFKATESHTYQVTQMFPNSTAPGGWCETPTSNQVKYNGTTGDVEGELPEDRTNDIFNNVTPQKGGDCQAHCGENTWFWNVSKNIAWAVCNMQCALIAGIGEFLGMIVESILMPSLGF